MVIDHAEDCHRLLTRGHGRVEVIDRNRCAGGHDEGSGRNLGHLEPADRRVREAVFILKDRNYAVLLDLAEQRSSEALHHRVLRLDGLVREHEGEAALWHSHQGGLVRLVAGVVNGLAPLHGHVCAADRGRADGHAAHPSGAAAVLVTPGDDKALLVHTCHDWVIGLASGNGELLRRRQVRHAGFADASDDDPADVPPRRIAEDCGDHVPSEDTDVDVSCLGLHPASTLIEHVVGHELWRRMAILAIAHVALIADAEHTRRAVGARGMRTAGVLFAAVAFRRRCLQKACHRVGKSHHVVVDLLGLLQGLRVRRDAQLECCFHVLVLRLLDIFLEFRLDPLVPVLHALAAVLSKGTKLSQGA
mmetsp:Transcript_20713/g.45489  ORF Transcript_20713/g.45489 Transcript_20713/m.45489 type:complete len:361 (-) Transcript_20713:370-1452(-)